MNRISLALLLAAIWFGQAQAGSQPASRQPHGMAKMWETPLARKPVAATATFNAKGYHLFALPEEAQVPAVFKEAISGSTTG